MPRSWPLLGLGLALACSPTRTPPFTPPESGGPEWNELRSPHFVVRSDLPLREVRGMIEEFERMYTTLEDLVFPGVGVPAVPMSVLVLRSPEEFAMVAPPATAGFYLHRLYHDDDRLPSLIIHSKLTSGTRLLLQHELSHRFVAYYLPDAPAWLNEGLAQYNATITTTWAPRSRGRQIVLGMSIPHLAIHPGSVWFAGKARHPGALAVPVEAMPSIAELLAGGPEDFHPRPVGGTTREADAQRIIANSVGAWALVHVLKTGRELDAARLTAFFRALARGDAPQAAWDEAFADVSMTGLEGIYQAFLRRTETNLLLYAYSPADTPIDTEMTMSPAQVHLLWATIRPWVNEGVLRQARIDVGTAALLAPDDPEVWLWLARLDRHVGRLDRAERLLRKAHAQQPHDERYALDLFQLLDQKADQQPPEHRDYAALDAMIPTLRRATSAGSLHALAVHLARRGQLDDALVLARSAVAVDFACYPCLDTLAGLYFRTGAHEQAYRTATRALNIMADGARDDQAFVRLKRYRDATVVWRRGG